jgi:hypothetical protein
MAQVSRVTLPVPLLMGIVATRAALGVGVGLLIADRLKDRRKVVGATLVAIGALTTIPAAIALVRARRDAAMLSAPAL